MNGHPQPPSNRRRLAWSLLVIHVCLYAPFSWLLWINHGWQGGYRWHWVKMWPVLPGFVPGLLLRNFVNWQEDGGMILVMALATVLQIVLFTGMGRRGRVSLIASAAVALTGATASSWIAYRVFLM